MNKKGRILTALFVVVGFWAGSLQAARIITVDDDGLADFNTIQAAIDDSNDGDTIIVQPGLYDETINFIGKNITLRSAEPTNLEIVRNTTIEGEVYFRGTEGPACLLSGFNIDGYVWGNESGVHTHATISNCLLGAVFTFCTPAISACDGTIRNCIIEPVGISCLMIVPEIWKCNGLIENCTILGSMEVCESGTCTLRNCIIYYYYVIHITIYPGATLNVSYCDVEGGLAGIDSGGTVNWGPGNIDVDPLFVDSYDSDYHLKSQAGRWDVNEGRWTKDGVTSLCIDAGNPTSPIGDEPFPNGGVINMGAYGGTPKASKSYFGEPVCEAAVAGDINGDCKVNFKDFAIMALHWCEDNRE
jgi:hypothetical protein